MERRKNEGKRSADPKGRGTRRGFGGGEIRAEQAEGVREKDREQVRATLSGARLHLSVNMMNQRAKHVARTLFHLTSLSPLPPLSLS